MMFIIQFPGLGKTKMLASACGRVLDIEAKPMSWEDDVQKAQSNVQMYVILLGFAAHLAAKPKNPDSLDCSRHRAQNAASSNLPKAAASKDHCPIRHRGSRLSPSLLALQRQDFSSPWAWGVGVSGFMKGLEGFRAKGGFRSRSLGCSGMCFSEVSDCIV